MAGSYEANLDNFVRDRVCTFLGNAANFYGAVEAATGGPSQGNELHASVMGQVQAAYRGYCGAEPPPPNRQGGDCPVAYGVRCNFSVYLLGGQLAYQSSAVSDCNFAPFIYGPVGGARIVRAANDFVYYVVSGYAQDGTPTVAAITDQVNSNVYRTPVIDSLEFYACNPGEANCDPVPIPSGEVEFPVRLPDISFNYEGDDNNNYDFSANILIGPPTVNVTGNFRIPVTLTFGPNTLNVTPQLDLSFGGDTNNYISSSPPPPPPPRTRNPIERITRDRNGEEPPPPPEPPEGSEIELRDERVYLGMLVVSDVTESASVSTIFQSSNPDIYVPCLGHVNFWYKVGDRTAWSEDIKVKNDYQLVLSPDPLRTIAAYGTPQPGVEMKFFPVYVPIEAYLGYNVTNVNSGDEETA